MKEINLTRGLKAIVDDDDYEFLNTMKWFAHKRGNHFYATRKYLNKQISMHRQIMGIGDLPIIIDHKDLNTLNNQKNNLRLSNKSQNNCNTKIRIDNTSNYKGVAPFRSRGKGPLKWRSTISKDKKWYHLGYFKTPEEAAKAYNEAAIKYHGEFANLNII
jgi:hypothetical protein